MSECLSRLANEISGHLKTKPHATIAPASKDASNKPTTSTVSPSLIKPTIPESQPLVLRWSPKKVATWLLEKKIHPVIVDNINPCSGKILHQLYEMQQTAPEFFYRSITSNQNVPTSNVAMFAYELKSLFI